jgi:hypothetical protein
MMKELNLTKGHCIYGNIMMKPPVQLKDTNKMLGKNARKEIETISCILPDHNGIKVEKME